MFSDRFVSLFLFDSFGSDWLDKADGINHCNERKALARFNLLLYSILGLFRDDNKVTLEFAWLIGKSLEIPLDCALLGAAQASVGRVSSLNLCNELLSAVRCKAQNVDPACARTTVPEGYVRVTCAQFLNRDQRQFVVNPIVKNAHGFLQSNKEAKLVSVDIDE